MRLGSVLSEALRNIGSGVSRAFAMFLAVLLSGTLLGGYEAMTVIDLESQAVQRINAYADVNAIVGGTVDGTACDRLSDAGDGMTGTLAGAMRAGEQVVPLATPGKDISSYDVTPGMIRLIAGNAKADVSGVWVPRDVAKDFGLAVGSALRTREGTTRVAGRAGILARNLGNGNVRIRVHRAGVGERLDVQRMLGQAVAGRWTDGKSAVCHVGGGFRLVECGCDAGE